MELELRREYWKANSEKKRRPRLENTCNRHTGQTCRNPHRCGEGHKRRQYISFLGRQNKYLVLPGFSLSLGIAMSCWKD